MYHILQNILPHHNPKFFRKLKKQFGTFEKDIQPFNVVIGAHFSIITNDDPPKIIFCRKSKNVARLDGSKILCGITESFQVDDITNGVPDIYKTVVRGLKEEINISISDFDKDRIKIFGCGARQKDNIWGFAGVVDFRGYPNNNFCEDKISLFWDMAKDSYEVKKLYCIPLNISSVLQFLQNNNHLDEGAVALAIGTLYYSFSEEIVNDEIFNLFTDYGFVSNHDL